MEGNPCKAALFAEELPRQGQRRVELGELVVDRDADRLERTLGGMATGEAGRHRDRGGDDLDELLCRLDRRAPACADERSRDLAGVALLAQLAQGPGEPALVPLVDDLACVEL